MDRHRGKFGVTEDELFAAVHRTVLRSARRLVGADLADDLAQEVMVVLLERYRGRGEEDLLPLATATLKWRVRMFHRKRARRRALGDAGLVDDFLFFHEEPAAEEPDPEAAAVRRELRDLVTAAVARLAPVHRGILGQLLTGNTLKEIVDASGLPSGTVYARSSRARQALARELLRHIEG